MDQLESEITTLRGKNTTLRGQNTTLQGQNTSLQSEVDALRIEVDALQSRIVIFQELIPSDSSWPSSPGGSPPSIKHTNAFPENDSSSGSRSQTSQKPSDIGTDEVQALMTDCNISVVKNTAKVILGKQSCGEFVRNVPSDPSMSQSHVRAVNYAKNNFADALAFWESKKEE